MSLELRAGDEVPSYVRTTGLANWNRYAAVNDEFIDIHMDAAAARAVGMPDVFGMGNLRISLGRSKRSASSESPELER